jgi:D-alanyl-D-alanine dipeptidase
LENLHLLDDLMLRRTLAEGRVALLNIKQSIFRRLSLLHGFDADLLLSKTLSGASWVAKFSDSKSTAALDGSFASSVDGFIDSMTTGGATVSIGTTLRPKERAYLMHYAFRIANDQIQPSAVPAMVGVDIEWNHGDFVASKKAAEDMLTGYGIVAAPALNSRHTEGKAIDMTIAWSGTLNVKDKSGTTVKITTTPRTGENADLAKVGKSFGVVKASFAGDPPHWSSDGH